MNKLSKYVWYKEAVRSQTAIKFGIDNTPNKVELSKMIYISKNLFDKVREHFGVPIFISSFFRSNDLNRRIGGSKTSQHRSGEAIDIDADVYGGVTNSQIFHYIKDNLEFDQLIWEFGTDENPDWVHVSLKKNGINRKQVLKATRLGRRVKYDLYR